MSARVPLVHPALTRRAAVQAGAVGLLGLGMGELKFLRAAGNPPPTRPAASVVYIFLSGGLSQHDSFDPKPGAPANVRGEFRPIPTRTPGVHICEHLPLLAGRSDRWALVRSLTHRYTNHQDGHHVMLTGRSELPAGFDRDRPKSSDWPAVAAVAGAVTAPRNNLPPAVVLPDRIVQNNGRVVPGQFGGLMGRGRDPWFFELSPYEPKAYGAFPGYEFDHLKRPYTPTRTAFAPLDLTLPAGLDPLRIDDRLGVLRGLDRQRAALDEAGGRLDRTRQDAVSLLTDPKLRRIFDLSLAPARVLDRYGRNAFGWSLLIAARLVEAGVTLVQVNLGNDETWDTHGNAFPHLRDKLLPPTDKAVSALLDDLADRGLLDSTLVVMAGEFGRTPKVTQEPEYKLPGRDHWGMVQTVFLAGRGVGGRVVGSSDKNGAYPATEPQTPEAFAATMYYALGIPKAAEWRDTQDQPHAVYHGDPIPGLA